MISAPPPGRWRTVKSSSELFEVDGPFRVLNRLGDGYDVVYDDPYDAWARHAVNVVEAFWSTVQVYEP